MRIIQINTFPYKATGAIMMGIHQLLVRDGDDLMLHGEEVVIPKMNMKLA